MAQHTHQSQVSQLSQLRWRHAHPGTHPGYILSAVLRSACSEQPSQLMRAARVAVGVASGHSVSIRAPVPCIASARRALRLTRASRGLLAETHQVIGFVARVSQPSTGRSWYAPAQSPHSLADCRIAPQLSNLPTLRIVLQQLTSHRLCTTSRYPPACAPCKIAAHRRLGCAVRHLSQAQLAVGINADCRTRFSQPSVSHSRCPGVLTVTSVFGCRTALAGEQRGRPTGDSSTSSCRTMSAAALVSMRQPAMRRAPRAPFQPRGHQRGRVARTPWPSRRADRPAPR